MDAHEMGPQGWDRDAQRGRDSFVVSPLADGERDVAFSRGETHE